MRIDSTALAAVTFFALFVTTAREAHGGAADLRVAGAASAVVRANEILTRWEPVAMAAGVHSPIWRDVLEKQLTRMDNEGLQTIDEVAADGAGTPKTRYARFASAVKSATMQSWIAGQSGKGPLKLGSLTADQVFVPVVPCRIVDTRNTGPIAHGTARNYFFYAQGAAVDWSSQGGIAGAAGSTCPETVNPNGASPPSAVVATITVVDATAAGNLVAWGGNGSIPLASVANWNGPGDVPVNTTIIPGGARAGTGPGGAVLDFSIYYNGASGIAQVIVDVVGYLVENEATALECMNIKTTNTYPSGIGYASSTSPSCPTGYTLTGGGVSSSGMVRASDPELDHWRCTVQSPVTDGLFLFCYSLCCRLPGR